MRDNKINLGMHNCATGIQGIRMLRTSGSFICTYRHLVHDGQ
jgi:hypothetical protein